MKRKTMAIVFLLILAVPGLSQYAGTESIQAEYLAPESSADPIVIVSVGDSLYYHFSGEMTNETDDEPDDGYVRIEVTEIDNVNDIISYDFYGLEVNESEGTWDWPYMNDDMDEGDDRWLTDNFTHPIFNHSLIFSTDITNVYETNQTENTDQLIMTAFEATSINSNYVTEDGWHKVTFDLNKSDDPNDPMDVIAWVNVLTGIMTYYEETYDNQTKRLELVDFDIIGLEFDVPDSFGLVPGDTVDRFIPNKGDRNGDDGGYDDGSEYYYMWDSDDLLEDNDEYGSYYNLWEVREYNSTRYGGMVSADADYYGIDLTTDETLHVFVHAHNQQVGFDLLEIESSTGATLSNDPASDPEDYEMHIVIDPASNGVYEFAVFSDYEHKAGYILEVILEHDTYGNISILDDFLEYREGVQENDIFDDAVWLDQYMNPSYDDLISLDADYYNFSLGEYERLYVEFQCWDGSGVLLVEEYNSTGDLLQQTYSNTEEDFGLVIEEFDGMRRDVILKVSGGTNYKYQMRFSPLQPPFRDQWMNEPDYMEDNNDYNTPFDISAFEFGVPGLYTGLNLYDNPDYYSFYVPGGSHVEVLVQYWPGADVALSQIDPSNGIYLQGPTGGDGGFDKNGHVRLEWDTSSDGHQMVRVGGNTGYYDDVYSIRIVIDGNWGPEYWPNENNDGDDGNDGDDSIWSRETVEFVYHNPYMDEDIIVVTAEYYQTPGWLPEEKVWARPFVETCRVDLDNIQGSLGDNYFHKDLDLSSPEFHAWIADLIGSDFGLDTWTNASDPEWFEMWGSNTTTEDEMYFFVQLLPDIGTIRYFNMERKDNDTENTYRELNFVIDCSAGGMNETDENLGVAENDWMQYLVQNQWQYREWGDGNDYWENREQVHFATFTVTHIFALNRTTMGVVGTMEVQTINNDGSINPDLHIESFAPLLVYDSDNPVNFVTMGGHGNLDGPPVLLPMIANWALEEAEMLALFENMDDGPGTPAAYNFDDDSVRFRFEWEDDEPDYKKRGHQDIIIDVNAYGMDTHLEMDMYEWSEENYEGNWHGREKRENFVAFMVDASHGCDYEDNIADVTGVSPLDYFVWERSEYRPATENDEARDPHDKGYSKWVIGNVLPAGGEFVVFLGAQFWMGPEDTEYHGQEWHLETEGEPIDLNYWYLGSVRDDDVWTWFQSQIFDIGIDDLSLYETEILEMLNYGLELGGTELLPANIDIVGRSFTVRIQAEGKEHVMRIAINEQGIMQDMFMGTKWDNGTWEEWDRTVLSESTPGYATGEVFMDDIPANYVQLDLTDPTILLISPSAPGDVEVGTSISITAADNVGVVELKYHWDSEAMVIVTGTLFTTPVPSALGVHELHIWATDEAGNEKYLMFAFKTVEAGTDTTTSTTNDTDTGTGTETTEPTPFDIPGYGFTPFAVFSLIGLIMIGFKRKKRS